MVAENFSSKLLSFSRSEKQHVVFTIRINIRFACVKDRVGLKIGLFSINLNKDENKYPNGLKNECHSVYSFFAE